MGFVSPTRSLGLRSRAGLCRARQAWERRSASRPRPPSAPWRATGIMRPLNPSRDSPPTASPKRGGRSGTGGRSRIRAPHLFSVPSGTRSRAPSPCPPERVRGGRGVAGVCPESRLESSGSAMPPPPVDARGRPLCGGSPAGLLTDLLGVFPTSKSDPRSTPLGRPQCL
jgi:hypothetical protein